MFPKRRRFGFFDFDEDFEHIREMMERMAQDAMKDMESGARASGPGKPLVYGFSMRVGPDGKPVVEEFGNVKNAGGVGEAKGDEREPLVDILNRKDEVTIIAEVPGVEKNQIKTKLSKEGDVLHIQIDNPERKYKKVLKLPARVKSDGASATYKNGVLEVRLRKLAPSAKEDAGHDIKVQ
jgi:HSP20 family protein